MEVLPNFSPPDEGIRHEQPSTVVIMNNSNFGSGTLYIAETELSWRNDSTGEGFVILYGHVGVFGVSRDVENVGCECLYFLVDTDTAHGIDEEEHMNESDQMTEIKFIPDDKEQLDSMYEAMVHCQSLHNDADSDNSEGEFLDAAGSFVGLDVYAGGDSDLIGNTNAVLTLEERNEETLEERDEDGQYEDAEEQEQEDEMFEEQQ